MFFQTLDSGPRLTTCRGKLRRNDDEIRGFSPQGTAIGTVFYLFRLTGLPPPHTKLKIKSENSDYPRSIRAFRGTKKWSLLRVKIAKHHLVLLVGLPLAVVVAVFAVLGPRQLLPSPPASPSTLSAPPFYVLPPQSSSLNDRALMFRQDGSKEEILAPTTSLQPAGKEATYALTPEEQQKMLSALQEEIQKKLNEDRPLQDLLRAAIQLRLEEEKSK